MISRILLIDDDPITVKLNRIIIQHYKLAEEVLFRFNGSEGLAYFDELLARTDPYREKPDLILLDLNMPVMNGWDFLEVYSQQYRHRFPDTRIIILSSSVDPADYERSRQFPAVMAYLAKPLTGPGLAALLEQPVTHR